MNGSPLALYRDVVRPEWIDHNHHLNVAFYVRAFDLATDAFFAYAGISPDYIERTGCSLYVLEMHVSYHREMKEGTPMRFETQVLDVDEKRIHFFHYLYARIRRRHPDGSRSSRRLRVRHRARAYQRGIRGVK